MGLFLEDVLKDNNFGSHVFIAWMMLFSMKILDRSNHMHKLYFLISLSFNGVTFSGNTQMVKVSPSSLFRHKFYLPISSFDFIGKSQLFFERLSK